MAEQQLEAAKQKAQQRRDRAQATLDRLRQRDAEQSRKRDTRRKILAGAVMLQGLDDERREDILAQLDAFLTKDRDRALFPELAGDGRT